MATARRKAEVPIRDLAEEIIRRVQAVRPDGKLPYVVRISDPPRANEQLQLIACQLSGTAVAIMPGKALTIDQWIERYAPE